MDASAKKHLSALVWTTLLGVLVAFLQGDTLWWWPEG
jgi:hypothetical protein